MKIGFISLGCPKNLVDSEVMIGLTAQAGHDLTGDAAEADVLVVNTCAFIDSAKQESIDAILEAASQKKDRRVRLVVTGCLAERYREQLQREIPEIDVVLGIDDVPDIVRAIDGGAASAGAGTPVTLFRKDAFGLARPGSEVPPPLASYAGQLRRGSPKPKGEGGRGSRSRGEPLPSDIGHRTSDFRRQRPTYIYDANTPRVLATPRHYAYLKVAEGCDYSCAFCIIPTLRGAYRSRPPDSIVSEATRLVRGGVREILLISQDTTFYGVDRGERGALARLLRGLNEVDGLEWIRLLYLYPTTVDEHVLGAMTECDKVCQYVDLPLQHASAAVLKRMKRPGTGDSYRRLLSRIRERVPGVALRTTFIVGFPGETEAEFDELRKFIAEVEFDHLGVFTYSHEEGTSAFALADDVPAEVKAERRSALMTLQQSIVSRRNRRRVGQRVRVLVDGPSAEHELVLKGRLAEQAPDIDPVVYLTDCDPARLPPGTFVRAEIVASHDYDLVAHPVDGDL